MSHFVIIVIVADIFKMVVFNRPGVAGAIGAPVPSEARTGWN